MTGVGGVWTEHQTERKINGLCQGRADEEDLSKERYYVVVSWIMSTRLTVESRCRALHMTKGVFDADML